MTTPKPDATSQTVADEPGHPWSRQPGEPPRAFLAFSIYRDLGIGTRSIAKAHEALARRAAPDPDAAPTGDGPPAKPRHGRKKRAPSIRDLERTSAKWRWTERAAAYDAELDRRAREANEAEILEMRQRWAKNAKTAAAVLFLPIVAIAQRYQRRDPKIIKFLDEADPEVLFDLGRRMAAAFRALAHIEGNMRGVTNDLDSEELEEAGRALDELAERLREVDDATTPAQPEVQ